LTSFITAITSAKGLRVVVVDACRDATFPLDVVVERGLDRRENRTGLLIIYSTKAGERASDGGVGETHSPFAQSFLDAVPTASGKDVRVFFAAVREGVARLTSNQQEPESIDRLSGDTLTFAE
jgi:hypothetical protein